MFVNQMYYNYEYSLIKGKIPIDMTYFLNYYKLYYRKVQQSNGKKTLRFYKCIMFILRYSFGLTRENT